MASVEHFGRIQVGNSCRTIDVVELGLSLQQMWDFDAFNSCSIDEDLLMIILFVGCHGGVGLAIKVAMVIMTSNGNPKGACIA